MTCTCCTTPNATRPCRCWLIWEIDEILKRGPELGTLVDEAQALRARLSAERSESAPGVPSLTAASCVLPMLATHLSFLKIGAQMFLSLHTIKSQVMSMRCSNKCSNHADLHPTLTDRSHYSDLPQRPSSTTRYLVCIQRVWTASRRS